MRRTALVLAALVVAALAVGGPARAQEDQEERSAADACLETLAPDASAERSLFLLAGQRRTLSLRSLGVAPGCWSLLAVSADEHADVDAVLRTPDARLDQDATRAAAAWVTGCAQTPAALGRTFVTLSADRRGEVTLRAVPAQERPPRAGCLGLRAGASAARLEVGAAPPRPLAARLEATRQALEENGGSLVEATVERDAGLAVRLSSRRCYEWHVLGDAPLDARWVDESGAEVAADRRGRPEASLRGCPSRDTTLRLLVSGPAEHVQSLLVSHEVADAPAGMEGDARFVWAAARQEGTPTLRLRALVDGAHWLPVRRDACVTYVAVRDPAAGLQLSLTTTAGVVRAHSDADPRGVATVRTCGGEDAQLVVRTPRPSFVWIVEAAP